MTGKFTPQLLEKLVLSRTGAPTNTVTQGPAYGEDAAAIQLEYTTLVVSTDPISLAAERIGQLGVTVASNDVAACGATPEWLTATILLPAADESLLDTITDQLDDAADDLGIAIVGGHTETVAGLDRPLVSLTCMGRTERFVPTSGAIPGDDVLLTKGAAIEGTAVLATDFRDDLLDLDDPDLSADVLDHAADFFEEVSVLHESKHLAPVASAMHDPTEGGVLAGLVELAVASGVEVLVDEEAIAIREETRRICAAMEVDPLRILGSGALLATVPQEETDEVVASIRNEGIEVGVVGRVEAVGEDESPGVRLGDARSAETVEDEIYALWE